MEKVTFIKTTIVALKAWTCFFCLALLISLMSSVQAQHIRNVMFNTPKSYQRERLPIVHINPDSVRIKAGYEHRIQIDDLIGVRFLNNLDITKGLTQSEAGSVAGSGVPFLVDKNGQIDLPAVGKLSILGLTKQEVKQAVEAKYAVEYRDPKVEIAVMNLSVSVMGEVGAPGVYPLMREKTTLIEILSTAGGLATYGKRSIVKVVRGVGLERNPEILIFDLRQLDAIRTEDMYLQDRDIVYVEPRDIKVFADAITPYTTFLSVITALSTIGFVLLGLRK